MIVELGTHYGESYFGLCQSVDENNVPSVCYAVDTWTGEPQAGFYGEEVFQEVDAYNRLHYASFSHLLRSKFDDALPQFADATIDLLHIDGLHTYEAVSHDFHNWLPKVKPGGVVLLHDIVLRSSGFEVWKLWDEIARQFPSFAFYHSLGLGVIRVGDSPPGEPFLRLLFASDPELAGQVRRHYSLLAEVIEYRSRLQGQRFRASDAVCIKAYACGPAGYEENTSASALVETGKWHRLTLEVEGGSDHGPIRLDPCETPAIVDLAEIQVRRARDSAVLWRADATSGFEGIQPARDIAVLSRDDVLRYFSYGYDSQLLLPRLEGAGPAETLLVDLWISVEKELGRIVPALQGGSVAPTAEERSLRERFDALARDNDALRAEVQRIQQEQAALAEEVRALKVPPAV